MKTTAQDVMSTEVLTIQEGAPLEEALKILINNRITGIPVTNKANEMIGIVSEYDILVQISEMPSLEEAKLDTAFKFTAGARSVTPNTSLKEVIDLFITLKYRRLPVVDKDKKLVGIITRRDLMRLFYYRARLK